MRTKEFQGLVNSLEQLTAVQRQQLQDRLKEAEDSPPVIAWIEGQGQERPLCPHCQAGGPMRWGKKDGVPRFRCRQCNRTFNLLTNTPLARLRHKERWPIFAKSMIEGQTIHKSAESCGVHYNTTFRWRHRFLRLPAEMKAKILTGIAEADETFVLRSHKGQRNLERSPRKRGGKASKRGRSGELVCILVARDRTGATTDHVLETFTSNTLSDVLQSVLSQDTMLCTDGLSVYNRFARNANITHKALNIKAGIRVLDKVFHIQNVNAYHSRFKNWMRRFKGVATSYLPNYLGWHRWLDRNNSHPMPEWLLLDALGMRYFVPANT